jgi:hypothetical protein
MSVITLFVFVWHSCEVPDMEDRNAGDFGHGPNIPFTVLLFHRPNLCRFPIFMTTIPIIYVM